MLFLGLDWASCFTTAYIENNLKKPLDALIRRTTI